MDGRRDSQANRPQVHINLRPKEILEKEFKTKMRGYDPAEVDEFLDDVIKDYETYNTQLEQLNQENARLISRIDELSKQAASGQGLANGQPNATNGNVPSNYDILKRLSNLERHVFGQQKSPAQPGTPATSGNNFNTNPNLAGQENRAGRYQNTITNNVQNRQNNYPNQPEAPVNNRATPAMPQTAPANNGMGNPNLNSNPNVRPNDNVSDPRVANANRNYNNYGNNRFDQNDPDPRFQNNTPNRYDNNDLNRF
ncbi:cell division regulator GpsB [Lactobacillus sp. CC-MHH1034]|nr:cell division regulator GpsB [Agrilactobacillus fermenti]